MSASRSLSCRGCKETASPAAASAAALPRMSMASSAGVSSHIFLCALVHLIVVVFLLSGTLYDDSTSPAYLRAGASAFLASAAKALTTPRQSPTRSAHPLMESYARAAARCSAAWAVCGRWRGTASCKVFHGVPSLLHATMEHAARAMPLMSEGSHDPSI